MRAPARRHHHGASACARLTGHAARIHRGRAAIAARPAAMHGAGVRFDGRGMRRPGALRRHASAVRPSPRRGCRLYPGRHHLLDAATNATPTGARRLCERHLATLACGAAACGQRPCVDRRSPLLASKDSGFTNPPLPKRSNGSSRSSRHGPAAFPRLPSRSRATVRIATRAKPSPRRLRPCGLCDRRVRRVAPGHDRACEPNR